MSDFDEEQKNNIENNDGNQTARNADEIDNEKFDYDKKRQETYQKYDFRGNRTEDIDNEFNSNKSYADKSDSKKQEWSGTKTGVWSKLLRSFPYPMLCLVIYLIVGFACNAWHPGWIIFLTIPAYYEIVESYFTLHQLKIPFFTIVLIAYLLMGFIGNLWHPGWVVFLAIPLYYLLYKLIKFRYFGLLIYTFICLAIYLVVGFVFSIWHPTWIIFLTIPIFGSIYNTLNEIIKEKSNAVDNKDDSKK